MPEVEVPMAHGECANMWNGILKNPNPWLRLYPWWDMSNASPHLRLEEATLEDWQYVKFQASLIWTCIDCNSSQSLDLASAANKASSLYLCTWTEGNGTSTSFRDTALWRKWTQHSSVFFRTSHYVARACGPGRIGDSRTSWPLMLEFFAELLVYNRNIVEIYIYI